MTVKRDDIKKYKGLLGRITFFDTTTKYFRLEHNDYWKATGYEADLEEPTTEEIKQYLGVTPDMGHDF